MSSWWPPSQQIASACNGTADLRETPFKDLLDRCERWAVHLETRDQYSDPLYRDWQAGRPLLANKGYHDWHELIRAAVGRGVSVRRARIVSEPLSDYIWFEHDVTSELNIAAGEQVRWLSRRRASGLLLPVNDFWLFDARIVRIHHFGGNGAQVDYELADDPILVRQYSRAFRRVWARAIDHGEYRPPLAGGDQAG
jgi:hypothetical protein